MSGFEGWEDVFAGRAPELAPEPVPVEPDVPSLTVAPVPVDEGSADLLEQHPLDGTDVAAARRLARLWHRELRWVPEWRSWLWWTGRRWQRVNEQGVAGAKRWAIRMLDAETRDVLGIDDEELRDATLDRIRRRQSNRQLEALLDVASSFGVFQTPASDLDRDGWLLNTQSGTVDLRTGELREHRPSDLLTTITPGGFDRSAVGPAWSRFLGEITCGDAELEAFLRRAAGMSAVGAVRDHVLLLMFGGGSNGKSTFIEALMGALGKDLSMAAPPGFLLAGGSGNDEVYGMADLRGKRLCVMSEIDKGSRLSEASVKRLTGGDSVRARNPYEGFVEFPATWSLWMAANHLPGVKGTDDGIWRRLKLVPFDARFDAKNIDRDLPVRLMAERDAVLAWIVRGAVEWARDGLGSCAAVDERTGVYRADEDLIGTWIEDRCVVDPDARVPSRELYESYRAWAAEFGLDHPLVQKTFGSDLESRGYRAVRTKTARLRVGLRVRGRDELVGDPGPVEPPVDRFF
jgi:putative DNA primase/helicase